MTDSVRWYDRLPSTQDEAHRLAAEGAAHGTAVAAREMFAGRGTRGRRWVAERGGLWLSVVCRPVETAAAECLSVRVGLAVAGALEAAVGGLEVQLKWPNDLMLGARKVGGILCEARWQGDEPAWIVVGVGLNVANRLGPDLGDEAARLADAGWNGGLEALAEFVAEAVAGAAGEGGALSRSELTAFTGRDWLRGRQLEAPELGRADGITTLGWLRVRRDDGGVAEALGTVVLARSR